MAEKNENNKDSQKGQVTPKKIFKKRCLNLIFVFWKISGRKITCFKKNFGIK
jgi:hypothetical protein